MSPWWEEYEYRPRRPADGIKAKNRRGAFGKNWWASRWIAALERLVDKGRLSRGRSYARSGQVLNLDLKPGRIESRVQGSAARPYKVSIAIKPLDDRAWDAVADAMAAQAIFAARLLAGEMPLNIEEAFAAAKVSLFPTKKGDLTTDCSCPDSANPCKHVAAVYYLLGEQFDEDPFLIFGLRGRGKEQIIEMLRARRAGDQAPAEEVPPTLAPPIEEQVAPLEESLSSFWAIGAAIEPQQLHFTIAAPPVDAALVKRLGAPPFWRHEPDFSALMSRAYAGITRDALDVALGT